MFNNNKTLHSKPPERTTRSGERGNVMFMILLAIALIGLLSIAVQRGSNTESANINAETLALRAGEVQRMAAEFERGIGYIMQNGPSEEDFRFGIPGNSAGDYGDVNTNPQWQMFHSNGGNATYRQPPADIQTSAAAWEFYGTTAIPGAATDRAELIAVLPNVTRQFCEKINALNSQIDSQPAMAGSGCIHGGAGDRFDGSYSDGSPRTLNQATLTKIPAMQACVHCASTDSYHFYHVLYPR